MRGILETDGNEGEMRTLSEGLHVVAISLLLYRALCAKNVRGFSLRSQQLLGVASCVRFVLPLSRPPEWLCFDVFHVTSACIICFSMSNISSNTLEPDRPRGWLTLAIGVASVAYCVLKHTYYHFNTMNDAYYRDDYYAAHGFSHDAASILTMVIELNALLPQFLMQSHVRSCMGSVYLILMLWSICFGVYLETTWILVTTALTALVIWITFLRRTQAHTTMKRGIAQSFLAATTLFLSILYGLGCIGTTVLDYSSVRMPSDYSQSIGMIVQLLVVVALVFLFRHSTRPSSTSGTEAPQEPANSSCPYYKRLDSEGEEPELGNDNDDEQEDSDDDQQEHDPFLTRHDIFNLFGIFSVSVFCLCLLCDYIVFHNIFTFAIDVAGIITLLLFVQPRDEGASSLNWKRIAYMCSAFILSLSLCYYGLLILYSVMEDEDIFMVVAVLTNVSPLIHINCYFYYATNDTLLKIPMDEKDDPDNHLTTTTGDNDHHYQTLVSDLEEQGPVLCEAIPVAPPNFLLGVRAR